MPHEAQPRKPRYRTCPPPPAPLESYTLMEDLEHPLARVLWAALNDVQAWAADPDARRPRDPAEGERERRRYAAVQAPELAEALGVFATLRSSPQLLGVGQIAKALRQVHDWALQKELTQTALLFAEAAASVDEDNPHAQNVAGRIARRAGDLFRAEVWYDRAYTIAARHRSRREKISALIGRGGIMREQGRFGEARRVFDRAAGLASSTRRQRQAAEVQHELLTISAESEGYAEAEFYMRAALAAYPIHHPALPWLAHDWCFLLVRLHLYQEALALLEAVTHHVTRKDLLAVVLGTLAHAAAGAGRRDVYDQARERVLELVGLHEEYGPAALAHLAQGARFFREWEMAQQLAEQAIVLARRRQQADVESGAEEILEGARLRRLPPPQANPPQQNRLQSIESRMLARLQERLRPPRREVVRDPQAGGRPERPSAESQPTGPRTDPAPHHPTQ